MKNLKIYSVTCGMAVGIFLAAPLSGIQSTWTGGAGDSDYFRPGNWSSGIPQTQDYAKFSSALPLNVEIDTAFEVTGIMYTPEAPSYTLDVFGKFFSGVSSGGIVNQSSNLQTINVSRPQTVLFILGPVSGNVKLNLRNSGAGSGLGIFGTLSGSVHVVNESTGAIVLGSLTSTPVRGGTATFENRGGGDFSLAAGFHGDQSTMLNSSGTLAIETADLQQMTIVNNASMTIAGVSFSSVSVGTLGGSGTINLGRKSLFIGSNDSSSEISGVISGSGGSLVKLGAGTLILSGDNVYTGSTTIKGGTLQATTKSLRGNVFNDAQVILDQDFSGSLNGALAGAGTLTTRGAGQITIAGNNSFTGTVNVADGVLNVTGSLPASTRVEPAGQLIGTGSVGAISNAGTVRPGAGAGGSLTAASYSGPGTLEIPSGAGAHPILAVTGNAALDGGTLELTGESFNFGRYTVLTAGSVNGTFSATTGPIFLDFSTTYTPTQVQVDLHSYNLANAAVTENQRALAAALDTVANPFDAAGAGAPVAARAGHQIFQLTSAGAVHQAFEQLSGDSLASFYDVGLWQGRLFTDGLTERPVPMEAAATAMKPVPIQLAMNGNPTGGMGAKGSKKRGLWARPIIGFSNTDSDSDTGSPSASSNAGGFEVGYDQALGQSSVIGAFTGYSRTSISVDDRDSTGHTNAVGFGVYGRSAPGAWFFDGSAAFIHTSNQMDRTIAFTGETAEADFSSPLLSVYGDAGYAFQPAADLLIEPFLALRISRLSQGGFTETGAPTGNLSVESESLTSVRPLLAVRGTRLFKPESRHPFLLGGSLGLEFEMGETAREVSATFADSSGPAFTVKGTPQKRTAIDFKLGGRVAITESWQGYLNYGLTLASQHMTHAIISGARLSW